MALEVELNKTTSTTLTTGNIVLVALKSGNDGVEWIEVTTSVDALIYVYSNDETPPDDADATPAGRGKPWPARVPYAHRPDTGTLFVEGDTSSGDVGAIGLDR